MAFGEFLDSKLSKEYSKINKELERMAKSVGRKLK